jgi:[acyl-carrier-protein] S-malonyltransferase
MNAYVFPGQGSQSVGMGKNLFETNSQAKELFLNANEVLGFSLTDVMFEGTEEELKQTKITQPAIFTLSVVLAKINNIKPDMVAGHSLGEFSALVANGVIAYDDALRLVLQRALAMQAACELQASTMAAVMGLSNDAVEAICSQINGEIVVPANYNYSGQLVISGSMKGIEYAGHALKEAGAKRVLLLPVGGAFHSPLMEPARLQLAEAIDATPFGSPSCPIYQNATATAVIDTKEIKHNLITQLTAPVRWSQSIELMDKNGVTKYIECGPGKVLQGLIKKIIPTAVVESVE